MGDRTSDGKSVNHVGKLNCYHVLPGTKNGVVCTPTVVVWVCADHASGETGPGAGAAHGPAGVGVADETPAVFTVIPVAPEMDGDVGH